MKMNGGRRTRWACSTEPRVSHYKISIRLKRNIKKEVLRLVKSEKHLYSSFGVIRCEVQDQKFTYTAYYSGHVNVVGIRKQEDIKKAVRHFLTIADLQSSFVDTEPVCTIDNLTFSGKYGLDMRLPEIMEILEDLRLDKYIISDFKPAHFRAAHIHFPAGGLITLYHTGSYTLVGVSTEERARQIYYEFKETLADIHRGKGKILL